MEEQRIRKAREQERLVREKPLMIMKQGVLELAEERVAELRNDLRVDPARIGDLIRLEQAELRLERGRELELGLQQEIER